ncbi:RelA/SpoT family protein [Xiamenia xianingshaonis]|uniref:Bifunctional (P)ppGpp synthetase/guanosine-3',5'-bis(Diphosphate) 3'-pyrophosphohydrolase n=1 Tax=Xiamenia xianingshaonis TaxID=2682776 RepID=A0A9E6MQ35_9ACTN|nr:bifunctional (p)ppGpp synthetase/guanosine-3',5'-bis(diphosphate) 3'-pyrophosphohydrolase [Xiamenia xianingshaonis]NHM14122.1 RelA/SpoT family protein [Xiamenia xianingshaonis]QTU83983.1 bifunctional (p)ppGpp synthetase/guanosine-3',5'-bis(diphosphate) 3'-pyrophosphohydrolase [Xiamenia xianingshaonis]
MAKKQREAMIGASDEAPAKQTVQDYLGRPRVAQKVFATDTRPSSAVETPEERFEELQAMTTPYLTADEETLLAKAFAFASKAHAGQCRKSGEPFVAHPVEVAIILADLHMDVETLCAAILHDTVEDTDVTSEIVKREFGEQVSLLVDGVTKITRIEVENLTDEQAATMRKMFVAMSKDIRVVVIKLADRLHNMRTLGALREDRRIFKSRETLEIYAPIAHRLGINSIKWELEDLAFFYMEPNKFKQVSRMVTESRASREAYLDDVIKTLRDEMDKVNISSQVMGRPKHLYSIYQKMTKKGKGFSEIYDLIAVRVIVKTVKDCYSALGAVHTLWHPMPGRFKDYIAMPKFNMYQSLHTTVIGPAGRPLEVQIRTKEMHRQSEYGVAAHWRYKEKGGKRGDELDQQLAWLRQMVDWQDDTRDSREFLKDLKVDLAPTEVFVFTPKGEVLSLRSGSTPIDFAYAIHTEVGNHCVGAKVNGVIVPLSYELQLGDRVEIMTQKSASPSRNWLNLVKTPSARGKIRSYFSKVSRSDDLQIGRDRLTREMRKHGMGISNAQAMRAQKTVAEAMGFRDADDMLVHIGTGKESVQAVANRMLKILVDKGEEAFSAPSYGASDISTGKLPPMLTSVKRPKKHEAHTSNGVVVKGLDDVLVRLSRCCNPVPGDDILGFVTRGRGVSVHRADCPNAKDLMSSPERIIDVSWEGSLPKNTSFKVEVFIEALDRTNLLRDVVVTLSDSGANVLSCSTVSHRDNMVEMRFLFQVSDIDSIEYILAKLRKIDNVFDAKRMVPNVGSKKKAEKKTAQEG